MTNNSKMIGDENALESTKAFVAEWLNRFSTMQAMLDEIEQLRQRVAALESENEALTETMEQWKKGNEWSSRVTYENMVEQIAACEDPKERDEARKLIEPLLKKGQVTQFRRDIKRRAKELNEENDTYSDKQVAQALEACVGKGLVVDAKWKWAAIYWYLRWMCNYPVDVKEFCARIRRLDLMIDVDYECSYESIRKICTLSFMDEDARRLELVRVSRNDQSMFSQCREIVLKLAEELSHT
jgi:polyhydroxyalkanoate synthesis regulator phasin